MLLAPHTLASPPLFMAADIRALEQCATSASHAPHLMEAAGIAVAALAGLLLNESGAPILILVGPGNNGGDALVAARVLREQGFRIAVVSQADCGLLSPDAARAWSGWRAQGGTVMTEIPHPHAFSLVIDGLFGVGLQREVTGYAARWVRQVNVFDCPRLAVDMPSGIGSDTGRIHGCALQADHTLTFLGLKPGLFTADGLDHAGNVHLETLGIQAQGTRMPSGVALTQLTARHRLPKRAQNSHKGLFGHVGIIGGQHGMAGACLIAGRAALKQGAGSVTLGTLDERIVVDYAAPRLMFAPPETLVTRDMQVLAIGPGLGADARAEALLATALSAPRPLVLDADALNLIAGDRALAQQTRARLHPTVLTPHPGEAARLLGVTTAEVQANRIEAAHALSEKYHAEIALKGAGTVIGHRDGHYAINTSGGPWLAQAGSGDRLTGIVAALLGQGMATGPALEASVWLHGRPEEGSHPQDD